MIVVDRRTFKTKPFRVEEMVDLIKGMPVPVGATRRIYTYITGPWNIVVQEMEYKDPDLLKMLDEELKSHASPDMAALIEKFCEPFANDGVREYLILR